MYGAKAPTRGLLGAESMKAEATLYRRERWQTPDGKTLIAPLAAGIVGGCGPHLRRFVLGRFMFRAR